MYNSFLCRRSASTSEERFGTFGARTSKRRWSAIRRCDMCVRLDTSGGERGERTLHSQQQGSNTRIAVSVTEFRKNQCPSFYFLSTLTKSLLSSYSRSTTRPIVSFRTKIVPRSKIEIVNGRKPIYYRNIYRNEERV